MNEMLLSEVATGLIFQTSTIIAITFGLDRWMADSRATCRLWTACFVSVLMLTIVGLTLPHFRFFGMPEIGRDSFLADIVLRQPTIVRVLCTIWMTGFAWMILRRGIAFLRLNRFLNRDCRPITETERAALPIEPGEFDDSVRLLICESTNSPFCWQFHHPTIVIPHSMLSDTAAEQRHILLHEREHLQTNHPLQHFLQGICGSLFWFHPLIWMASRRAELVREFLCDEYAAVAGGKVSSYLRTLAKIAERGNGSPTCVLSFGRSKSALVRRSEQLVTVAAHMQRSPGHRPKFAMLILITGTIGISQVWLPVNALASSRSKWSPWPTWSAETLHDFGYPVRDFEKFDDDHGFHHLFQDD
ncbi:Regulatory protein BlaR1 [Rubripirellula tenax]|uniref:Regulatory protein BlaR1 n=1 Tax=Rubripirellula tenax TaxID=2528015 RepID=A0A5C6EMQ9_9BACT|nr:M56 family metallopeptidase [Rubripirellula tenax]TWU48579.1 Regulatory protein BlaR1 [Rubripirellula tenax]